VKDWENRIKLGTNITYKNLLRRPSDRRDEEVNWATMQSMREIDTDTFVEIKSVYVNRN